MNERIRSLLERAEYQVGKQYGPDWEVYVEPSREQILEKFAELIVRECARAVDKVYEDAEPDHGCYDWATWAEGADVLKHFGVEE
jgi:hypothetical protein